MIESGNDKDSEKIDFEVLRELIYLLSKDDESLYQEVLLSVKDPEEYVNLHAEELKLRGISKPEKDLLWIALADGLIRREKLIEKDWKESAEMFIKSISELLAKEEKSEQAENSLKSLKPDFFKTVPEILSQINQVLRKYNFAVIVIDLYSDSYPIMLAQFDLCPNILTKADLIEKDRIRYFQ